MPINQSAESLSSLLTGFHRSTDGYRAQCPAHNGDNNTSLHIWEKGGKTYFQCFAHNCKLSDILKALGIESYRDASQQQTACYDYTDEAGNLLFQSVRTYKNGKKTFFQRQPDPANPGKYINSIKGVRQVPYRLPAIIQAIKDGVPILIVEGEKDVHTAEGLGFVATTNAGGAGKWRKEHSAHLNGAHVVIIPDNDDAGRLHEQRVKNELRGIVASMKAIHLPSHELGWDLTDWVETGGTATELQEMMDAVSQEGVDEEPASWMSQYNNTVPLKHKEEYDTLAALLSECLANEDWHKNPEQTELYPFLAKCWAYPQLRMHIHDKVSFWRKDRYDSFEMIIRSLLPKEERTDSEERAEIEAYDESIVDLDEILQCDAKKRPVETVYNMAKILELSETWRGRLRFDSFLNESILDGKVVNDITEMRIAEWLGDHYRFGGNNPKHLTRGIYSAGSKFTYDSLQDWLFSLPEWDGTDRIRHWLATMCGAANTALTSWMGFATIMQMVARAITPGCVARLVAVFEGPENRGKTRCIRIIGHPWSMTFDMSMDSKEAHMAVAGCWVAELAELDTLRKTTETRLKSFVSQQTDDYIPKYSNHRMSHPRRTVFIGTTNDENYLPGNSGNTRWLPVKTPWFDLDKVEREREQLFAEALFIFKTTPDVKWWEEPEALQPELARERKSRQIENVYEDDLSLWLDNKGITEITWPRLAVEYLQMEKPESWKDKRVQIEITAALKSLGWEKKLVWDKKDQKPKRVWIKQKQEASDTGTSETEIDDLPF